MTNSIRWTPRDIDDALVAHLHSGTAAEASIRELINQGADVNAVDEWGESVLMYAIECTQDDLAPEILPTLDPALISVLIDLGADVNHQVDGLGPLYTACLIGRPDIVELLLRCGANPNVILELDESLLDSVEYDQWRQECEAGPEDGPSYPSSCRDPRDLAKRLARIIVLLKDAGAKPKDEIEAPSLGAKLTVFAVYPTGLLTDSGNWSVHRLAEATPDFRERFGRWLAAHFDPWPETDAVVVPAGFDRAQHIAEGRQLAREIQGLVGPHTTVRYRYLSAEAEAEGKRGMDSEELSG